jgi:hypothetical protein
LWWVGDVVIFRFIEQNEERRFARLLMIRDISLRAAFDSRVCDAVDVTEVDLGDRDWDAIHLLDEGCAIAAPEFLERASYCTQLGELSAAAFKKLVISGIKSEEDVIASLSKCRDPAVRSTFTDLS